MVSPPLEAIFVLSSTVFGHSWNQYISNFISQRTSSDWFSELSCCHLEQAALVVDRLQTHLSGTDMTGQWEILKSLRSPEVHFFPQGSELPEGYSRMPSSFCLNSMQISYLLVDLELRESRFNIHCIPSTRWKKFYWAWEMYNHGHHSFAIAYYWISASMLSEVFVTIAWTFGSSFGILFFFFTAQLKLRLIKSEGKYSSKLQVFPVWNFILALNIFKALLMLKGNTLYYA